MEIVKKWKKFGIRGFIFVLLFGFVANLSFFVFFDKKSIIFVINEAKVIATRNLLSFNWNVFRNGIYSGADLKVREMGIFLRFFNKKLTRSSKPQVDHF